MEDLFKKFINAGVGLVSLTNDRVQKTIDALVKESKLSEQEGARIMDDLRKNTDTKRQEMEKQFQGLASRLMKSAGIATNADVEELKRTVKGGGTKTSSSSTSPAAAKVSSTSVKGTTTAAKTAAAVKASNTKAGNTTAKSSKSAAGKAGGESKETKANKTAAKKAISPNDNTSSSGSELS
ncbi:phasin family protein [Hymenobacter fodinae]|uniref:Polyhydroxyalkanoate synthesis regulator phasin n=1 Tax=Hymenobacter fodinae TaxID=2510796 RepID=A0A4Z0P5N5_9BACT|nr:hypothetical protein [Hymenobacter fodinae]TGE06496.1 hypothetical protein EU556_16815 [Hymenobacter fodinae]